MREPITATMLFKVLVTTIIWSVLAARAVAANVKDAQACDKVTDFDRSIPACTRYLASKNISTRLRAMALGDRCAAWANKGDHVETAHKEENWQRALADCNEALKLDPNLTVAYLNRGAVWSFKFDFDRALADYSQLILLAPKAPVGYFSRGQVWLQKRDFDRAISDANEVIRIAPNPEAGYELRGQAWFEKGDHDQAITDFDKAIRLNPRVSMAYNDRGMVWVSKGEYDRAIADYNEAIRIAQNNSNAFSNRGEAWRLKGDLDRAIADADQSIKLNPGGSVHFVRRGDIRRYRGEFELALADYDQALRLLPDYVPAFTGRGLTFEKMGDRERAAAEFKRALASPSQIRRDVSASALETARAHIAALEAGTPLPVIPAAPFKVASENSIPTPAVVLPDVTHALTHQRRVALVIGNSAYQNVPALTNPQHDAGKMAATLRAIGFDSVTLIDNATHQTLIDGLRAFAHSSEQADWAMIYYAGHGIEVNGVNFIIPIDAKLAVDRDVEFEAVPLDQIMTALEGARKLRLVLLDACRDNPFVPQMRHTAAPQVSDSRSTGGGVMGTRSIGRGLSEIKVSGATLVVYAAKSGQVALDGEGDDSPFAVAVIQRIAVPGVEINKVFRLVRDDVMEATAGRQEPYTYGSLPGSEDFYFVEK